MILQDGMGRCEARRVRTRLKAEYFRFFREPYKILPRQIPFILTAFTECRPVSAKISPSPSHIFSLLRIIVCPHCANSLTIAKSAPDDNHPTGLNRLTCRTCPYAFPIDARYFERKYMKRKEVDDVLEEGDGKGMDIAEGSCISHLVGLAVEGD